jgi:hypothetical protein
LFDRIELEWKHDSVKIIYLGSRDAFVKEAGGLENFDPFFLLYAETRPGLRGF